MEDSTSWSWVTTTTSLSTTGKIRSQLGLKSPEIPAPKQGLFIMVQTKKVVRFLGSPDTKTKSESTQGGGCKTVEFVVRVNLGRKVFLPKYLPDLASKHKTNCSPVDSLAQVVNSFAP